jgi:hypothetical protein
MSTFSVKQVMQEAFSIELHGALELSDTLFTEQSLASGESTPRHLEVLREALRPFDLLREDVIEPSGLAFRICRRIRELRQENFT